ncbi:DUF6279 family lipoprotein [Alteromonas sp. ASW11-19]|uniref:DUF6279 family lipoprotein n=1 Tax=Alteromonas salexigens TaxID=2982530 RepID=A0ABT2VLM2_9ALTE|nr:DUF6279 family lipoprotein [Alteromonas salexigens]MCU7554208.1 DUF6279 family lipoprotein [Alteromonas salexigens]
MKKLCVALLAIMLAGCSSKLAYNNLDWLVYWYMDDYVELTDHQEKVFDRHLQRWINWHRNEELNHYIAQLQTIRTDITEDRLTPQVINDHLEKATAHWIRLREEIAPELAQLATTLNDEQVIRLFAALEEDNKEEEEEYRERMQEPEEERLEQRIDDMTDNLEDRIGELSDQQKRIIKRYAPQYASTFGDWITYRRNIQNAGRKLFILRDSNPAFTDELVTVMSNPDNYRSPDYQLKRQQNRELYTKMIAEIASTFTAAQKRHLITELDEMVADLEDLLDHA